MYNTLKGWDYGDDYTYNSGDGGAMSVLQEDGEQLMWDSSLPIALQHKLKQFRRKNYMQKIKQSEQYLPLFRRVL